ncbi:MAG: sugar ABC transporter ATP-binding protein [Phycisphaerae bacterium]
MISFRSISKSFGGVTALVDVSFDVARGECHAVVGENGAGKSTLGKILAGIHRPDRGEMRLDGESRRFRSPADARAAGIGMVHQELAFCPDLSIAENLALGRYPRRAGFLLDRRRMIEQARRMLARIGAALDPAATVRTLSTAQEQLVQIAAAVGSGAKILVFDEPTSSLSESESQLLLDLIRELRRDGSTIIHISHRMSEVLELADRVTVLRDGRHVATLPRAEADEDHLVRLMIGRPLTEYFADERARPAVGARVLRVDGLGTAGRFSNISFSLHAGEILGLAGLVGAGRTEVARAIFGIDRPQRGEVRLGSALLPPERVRAAMRAGVAMLPEDRKRQGLILMHGGRFNASLAALREFAPRLALIDRWRERREVGRVFEKLAIRTPSQDAPLTTLSGGNQQKVALAKWLIRRPRPRVLILDEPTRGVDVGAKRAIHALIAELAAEGLAILLITSELPELLHLSSRILVMREGRIVGELARDDATQERLMRLMAGLGGAPG